VLKCRLPVGLDSYWACGVGGQTVYGRPRIMSIHPERIVRSAVDNEQLRWRNNRHHHGQNTGGSRLCEGPVLAFLLVRVVRDVSLDRNVEFKRPAGPSDGGRDCRRRRIIGKWRGAGRHGQGEDENRGTHGRPRRRGCPSEPRRRICKRLLLCS